MRKPCRPAPLSPGDTIGIIAPSGQIRNQEAFGNGINLLTGMGFTPLFPRELWPGAGYLADSDARRAEEFNRLWADPDIPALLALRGGYGCLRMAAMIDWKMVHSRPKLLIGFSDITVLHACLHQQTGLLSLHGPVLSSLAGSSRDTIDRFYQCLRGNWHSTLHPPGIEILRGKDEVRGELVGGNLSTLLTLLGTPLEPTFSGKILFLEDVGEPLYRIDRMLTQLQLAGKLQGLVGMILGDFSPGAAMDSGDNSRHHEEVWQRVLQLTSDTGIPVWGNFPIGHGHDNLTLPHGAEAIMDSSCGRLAFV